MKIKLLAHDLERGKQGWAAIVDAVSEERKPLYVFPPVRREEIFTRTSVIGDVVAVMQAKDGGEYEPVVYHLIRVDPNS